MHTKLLTNYSVYYGELIQPGEERVISLTLPGHNPSLREVRAGTQDANQTAGPMEEHY